MSNRRVIADSNDRVFTPPVSRRLWAVVFWAMMWGFVVVGYGRIGGSISQAFWANYFVIGGTFAIMSAIIWQSARVQMRSSNQRKEENGRP